MRFHLAISLFCCVALVLLVALTGSSDAVDVIQDNAAVPAEGFAGSGEIGQTFVARYPRLHAIQLRWIVSDDRQASPTSHVTLHLYRVGDAREVALATLPLNEIHHNDYAKFVFAPISDSAGTSFYFRVETAPAEIQTGSISLWSSEEDSYADGQMYSNQLATNGDLVFRTFYEPDILMLVSALGEVLGQYGLALLAALFVLLVPGCALLLLGGQTGGMEGLALAGGAGLALLSAASLVQLALPIPMDGIVLVVGGLMIGWRLWPMVREQSSWRFVLSYEASRRMQWPEFRVLALALPLLALVVALLQIRDSLVPLWVDSVVHAENIQSLMVNGRLPADIFYHLGYHATTAWLAQLTGLSIPQAMLLVGQLLLVQTGLSVFLLTWRLSASFEAGLVSALVVWFLSPTPSYFVTWGRYPLLMGSAILPVALYSAINLMEQPRRNPRAIFFAAVTLTGLGFAHVRLIVFYAAFVAVYLLYRYARRASSAEQLFHMAMTVGAGLLFGLAWLALVLLRGVSWEAVLTHSALTSSLYSSAALDVLQSHHGPILWLLASIALVVGLLRRSSVALVSLVWYVILFGIAQLPAGWVGGEYLSPGFVLLMVYLPAAMLTGEMISLLYNRQHTENSLQLSAWGAALGIVALLGARDMVSIVNPATVLFSSSDLKAMEWIEEKTPPDAKFLVNSFRWAGTSFAPADGGAWIPYLTGRPAIALFSQSTKGTEANSVGFIYLGRRNGILAKSELVCQPERYRLVYDLEGIVIFQVKGVGDPLDAISSPLNCNWRGHRAAPRRSERLFIGALPTGG